MISDQPMLDNLAITELSNILYSLPQPFDIFEWGSGGSTLWFGLKRLGNVYSIEHNPEWYNNVSQSILHHKLDNVQVELIVPINIMGCRHSEAIQNKDFSEYINYISKINKLFKFIFVDGRARNLCFDMACKYLDNGGYVILHDSERSRYNVCRNIANIHHLKITELKENRNTLICQKTGIVV